MTNAAAPIDRPRRSPLQFSLRLLLIAFTAFAIGFPVWYRWPYKEVATDTADNRSSQFVYERLHPFGGATTFPRAARRQSIAATTVTRTTTWQRQWGGGRLKQGVERVVSPVSERSTIYGRGRKHGPYSERNAEGDLEVKGQFIDGLKEGVWTYKYPSSKRMAIWHRDRLDGPYEIELPEMKLSFTFADGRLTHYNGQPARNRLFDLLEAGQIDNRTAAELRQETIIDFTNQQLVEALDYLKDAHNNLNIVLDRTHVKDVRALVSAEVSGVDLCSVLTVLTAPIDLGCDYRYGCIWITSQEDAEDWRDPTGVAKIAPTPGTDLARAWNEPSMVNVIEQPLPEVLGKIAQPLAIEIDTSRVASSPEHPEDYRVTRSAGDLPFRHVLGILLYEARCRCQLDGGKIVILPPKEAAKP
jgi:hypothetical protein